MPILEDIIGNSQDQINDLEQRYPLFVKAVRIGYIVYRLYVAFNAVIPTNSTPEMIAESAENAVITEAPNLETYMEIDGLSPSQLFDSYRVHREYVLKNFEGEQADAMLTYVRLAHYKAFGIEQ